MRKVLLTATVQSHICQFHKPLVEMLREQGDVEIHVAARNNLAEKNGLKLDFVDKVYDVPFSRSPKSTDNIKAYKQLKKIISEENYDIIHCNTPMGGIVTRLAAKKARKKGCKVIYTAHGFHFYNGAAKLNWIIYYPIEKLFARKTDILITINKEDYILAKERFSCKVEHIYGVGVDPKRYYPVSAAEQVAIKEKLGLKTDNRYIICVGELLPNKDQSIAIKAMKRVVEEFPSVVLLLAGNGPERENLENLIKNLELENNVKLIGYVTNLEEYQKASDIAVSCSKREGLPLNIVEAMLSGNAVIATYNRGHRELIQNEVNGVLIDQNDTDSLSKKMMYLLDNEEICREMRSKGMEIAFQYTCNEVKKELVRIYFEE